ncbi:dipeptide ABC transporter ATP-binding protein [Pseudomonas typographi]|uniref:ABC transporter ATP-binding protein n=1 Tax=Pseudomonas typographi TaxID=2715964 RepID=A0ABR7YWW2_9PSED|nr:ABC transporter ATP-binding protein [Pseudomonas typographi]MBD1552624.1 ABC transporter ATP-binding protein [Pseudomonas typographi]MBD1586205.1 ABC transporter ATP-binding protein [Pseudomonas typographi]MBD1597676.1 ABC transporter ATP-binding protein [Pseudomonas typographi]
MNSALLEVEGLHIALPPGGDRSHALFDVSLALQAGETLCVVGESGSGKSMLANAILRLLPPALAPRQGRVRFRGEDIAALDRQGLRQLRGVGIGMVFQEPMSALNPLLRVGVQIGETLRAHGMKRAGERRRRVIELLGYVGLPAPEQLRRRFPFQLSGGQRQRVAIAMALAFSPAVLIADEPTSALDVTTQAQILQLLQRIQRETGMAMLFITHDLALVQTIADRVLVLQKGQVVEQGAAQAVLGAPAQAYTRRLLAAALPAANPRPSPADAQVVLGAQGLNKTYSSRHGGWRWQHTAALVDVSMALRHGQTVGVVGESGSGKSTLGKALVRLLRPDSGHIQWQGSEVAEWPQRRLRPLRRRVQMIFQDPVASLNPRQTVAAILMAGPVAHGATPAQARARAELVLGWVGLPAAALERYPQAFSGGQRQRIGIARALSVAPDVLIADECVSALDALVQAQILDLLETLQQRLGLSIVFITHDLRAAARLCDHLLVMQHGRVVEQGASAALLRHPSHAYTRTLLASLPGPGLVESRELPPAQQEAR